MPNPKAGTVTFDVAQRGARDEGRQDRVPRRQGAATSTPPIGKVSFALEALETNFTAFMDQIVRSKPAAAKGVYVRNVVGLEHDGTRRQRSTPPRTGNER